jgi:PAS domain S-box-containing protein
MHGYTVEEVLRLGLDKLDVENTEAFPERIRRIMAGEILTFEVEHYHKDGHIIPLEVTASLITSGGESCFQCFHRDISERKLAEIDLKHSHELMSYVIQHNQSALAVHDKDMRYLYVSQRYIDDYKVKDTDIIGKHHYDVFPDLPQKWRDVHKRVLAGEVCSEKEDSYERADGSVDWTRWECRPWFEADGTIGGIIIYTEVITERKRADIALRKSEENFRTIIEVSPVPLAINDEHGNITFLNKAFVQAIGYNLSDIPTLEEWWTCAYPDSQYRQTVADSWMSNLEEAKHTNSPFTPMEVNIVCKNDSVPVVSG